MGQGGGTIDYGGATKTLAPDIMIGNGDDYTVGSLIDYKYFANTYKIIAVDLSRQKVLDADPEQYSKLTLRVVVANFKVIYIHGRVKRYYSKLYPGCR